MTKTQKKPRKPPGPAPEILKIEGDWKDAMRKLISKKRLVGGWPKPETTKQLQGTKGRGNCLHGGKVQGADQD